MLPNWFQAREQAPIARSPTVTERKPCSVLPASVFITRCKWGGYARQQVRLQKGSRQVRKRQVLLRIAADPGSDMRQWGAQLGGGNMRRLLIYLAVGAAALIVVPSGLSSTPTQIYRDYADNGRLDRHYSQSDMNRALKDAVLQGYGHENVQQGLQQSAQGGVAG